MSPLPRTPPRTTYLQEWSLGKWKLVVEVSEAMTSRHTFVIERVHKAVRQRPSMDKQDALQMLTEIVGRCCVWQCIGKNRLKH